MANYVEKQKPDIVFKEEEVGVITPLKNDSLTKLLFIGTLILTILILRK